MNVSRLSMAFSFSLAGQRRPTSRQRVCPSHEFAPVTAVTGAGLFSQGQSTTLARCEQPAIGAGRVPGARTAPTINRPTRHALLTDSSTLVRSRAVCVSCPQPQAPRGFGGFGDLTRRKKESNNFDKSIQDIGKHGQLRFDLAKPLQGIRWKQIANRRHHPS
jgi:hypothetical protein